MRILHVTDCYLPHVGGIELHVRDLAQRQAAAGHDVTVLTHTAALHDAIERSDEGPVRVVRVPGAGSFLTASRPVRQAVATAAPGVVQAHLSVASPFAWGVLREIDLPTVATVHSLVPDHPAALRAAFALIRFPHQRITMTAVSTVAAAPWRRALPLQTVRVLHNGIDPAAWRTPARTHARFTVTSVGRFTRRKRQLPLVRIVAEVRRRRPDLDLRVVLVGDGPERDRVGAAVRGSGLDDVVELPGILDREQIRGLLAESDVYVAPADQESFGIAALEARCAGVPVVGMASSGLTEFITHGREGLLAADDRDLVEQLLRLVADPVLQTAMRVHNSGSVPDMAWASVLRRHEMTYALAGADIGRASVRPAPPRSAPASVATSR